MKGCCDDGCTIEALLKRQRGTLRIVLLINSVMFLVIAAAALYSKSNALLADSFNNLGDGLSRDKGLCFHFFQTDSLGARMSD